MISNWADFEEKRPPSFMHQCIMSMKTNQNLALINGGIIHTHAIEGLD